MNHPEKIKFAALDKSLFFPTLKKRVDQYFEQNHKSRYANKTMVIKTVVLLSGYILPFIALIAFNPPVWVAMLLWLVMGISGIGMSVMHGANHGAFSKNPAINKWMGYTIDLAGAGVLNWKLQHNILHHTYTYVPNVDETTVNFSPRNKLLSWYIGGLNFQI
ncbi:fatty acid desaturase family protein [Dyadobacter alkalitolerans]|uniref:fatty acid desaturase family protein n=1 Tax=Dyadobacter alkalitolerans TaxID=492736 RepID=UPI0004157EE4|nr:fatty acid desaturase [Dyadobacter alkalitolerans]